VVGTEPLPTELADKLSTERVPLHEGVGLMAWRLPDGRLALNRRGTSKRGFLLEQVGDSTDYVLDIRARRARRHQARGDPRTYHELGVRSHLPLAQAL